ncbi:TonB-dependent receptor [Novosphingobium sp. KCTC 2891]|uniref:TonB-dependent receptor plug domain-containing protein n=1 Tax=Novosphingobium sp. KCTC 2891 TaxID=2989730 RepID=UPI00222363CC|nr:TonB-dependent receptor [Novosphingobium sp. KCTC 2891]MCW1383550.1 TonB-dependent receptor [Novosphingobium sp. KCTC 2891]
MVRGGFRITLLASVAALGLAPFGAAHAAEDAPAGAVPAAEGSDDSGASAIIVTGIRGGPQRTVAESPAPIDVVSGEKLKGTGAAEFGEALTKLLPSMNFASTHAGVFSVVRPVSNRGLSPAYTLVLVNGKRRHNSAFMTNTPQDSSGVNAVDLDLIPNSAIGRIEVLKDSAAAQYGTDAIAGVVNIQLDRREGFDGSFQYGEQYLGSGDRESWKAQLSYGVKIGDGFVRFSGDYRKRGGNWWNLLATDTNLYGKPSGRTVEQVAATSGLTTEQVQANISAANARNATWNLDGAHNGDPEVKAWNGAWNAELPFNDAWTFYTFGTFGHRDVQIGNNFRRPNGNANFTALFPDGYYPLNNISESDVQVVAGVKGDLAGWKIDASSSFGRNSSRQFSKLSIRPALGPTSPTSWDNLANFRFTEWTHNLDVTREVDLGLARPVQVSFGAEYRLDRFQTFAGQELAWKTANYIFQPGDQQYDWNVGTLASSVVQAAIVLSPADQADAKRRVYAGYVDLGIYPLDNWYIGAAVRAEHYSDGSGSPVGLKLNSRFEFSKAFALRGTVGTGFRAPSLTQAAYAQTDGRTALVLNPTTGLTEAQPTVAKLVTPDSLVGKLLGAQHLKAEKSWNAGLGFVFTPNRAINVTVDGYYINIKNRIERSGRLFGSGITAILNANGLNGIQQVEYFFNAADTTTTGVDVVADWNHGLDAFGQINLSAAFNYNHTKIDREPTVPSQLFAANGASLLGAGSAFFGGDRLGELTVINPDTKLALSANWTKGIFGLAVTTTRYGKYTQRTAAGDDRDFGAKWITDASISAAVTPFATVQVGATNVFNVRPETNGPGSPQTGQGYYGPSPFNPNGGYYYGRLSVSF